MFSKFNCSNSPLVNSYVLFYLYISRRLRQLLSNSYVPSWMNISQPRMILWQWVILCNFGGKIN